MPFQPGDAGMHAQDRFDAAVMVSPLTVMVRGVVEWTFPPGSFAELFGRYAPGQTTRTLTVDSLVGLMIDVVTGTRPSVYAAYVADQNEPTHTLTATHQAVYAKLGRLAPAFSAALVLGWGWPARGGLDGPRRPG